MEPTEAARNTRQEFLQAALDLFNKKGYDRTTIKDIIDAVGVSKGAFYHYFDCKEDIVTAIAREYSSRAIGIIKEVAQREDLNALEKINLVFQLVNQFKQERSHQRERIKGVFAEDGNLKMERKLFNQLKSQALRYFEEIVEGGIKEGLFTKTNQKEMAEFLLLTINNLNRSIEDLTREMTKEGEEYSSQELARALEERLVFYEEAFARILGLKEGEIHLKESYMERFLS